MARRARDGASTAGALTGLQALEQVEIRVPVGGNADAALVLAYGSPCCGPQDAVRWAAVETQRIQSLLQALQLELLE